MAGRGNNRKNLMNYPVTRPKGVIDSRAHGNIFIDFQTKQIDSKL